MSSTDDAADESGFSFPSRSQRGVGKHTDDAIVFVTVGTYLGVWAGSYAFPEVPKPPLSDATARTVTELSLLWVFGKQAYDRVKQSGSSR